jgi:carbon-monoxide dehydrogenase large subunit
MDAKTEQPHGATRAPRVEDDVLLRGRGRYVADAPLPNQAYAFFVRAPHAFARIVAVDFGPACVRPASSES